MYNLDAGSLLTKVDPHVDLTALSLLADKIHEEKCVLFAGTGISLASGPMTWGELIKKLRDFAVKKGAKSKDIEYIDEYIERHDYITAAELLQRSLKLESNVIAGQAAELMRTVKPDRNQQVGRKPKPNPVHHLLTRIGFNHIVTTNYDRLLELAQENSTLDYVPFSWKQHEDVLTAMLEGKHCLIKIHGSVDDTSDAIVLTRTKYLKVYSGGHINNWIRSSLVSNSFLFIGYSLNDFDILSLIKEAKSSVGAEIAIGPHFAILDRKSYRPIYANYLKECYNIESIRIEIHSPKHRDAKTSPSAVPPKSAAPPGAASPVTVTPTTAASPASPAAAPKIQKSRKHRQDANANNVLSLLVALHGKLALKRARQANFTLLPNSDFASAMSDLREKIEDAMGVDSFALYLVESVDSRTLMDWTAPLSPDATITTPEIARPEVVNFFVEMRDVHYCYLAHKGRNFKRARQIFGTSSADESLIAMPVVSQGKKWGLLLLKSRIPYCLTEDHLNALLVFTKAIADTFKECDRKNKIVQRFANEITFEYMRNLLVTNRIIKEVSQNSKLDYILYTIDYMRGRLIGHFDPRFIKKFEAARADSGGRPVSAGAEFEHNTYVLNFTQPFLAIKALERGTALRYSTPEEALADNPECKEGIEKGFELFDITGNVYVTPIRSFGDISAILVAWNKEPCADGRFHQTVFDRVKRMVRVFMNDPFRRDNSPPESGQASQFIKAADEAMRKVDGGKLWRDKLKDPRFQRRMINAILRILTHDSTKIMKVRLWLIRTSNSNYPEDPDIQLDDETKFFLHSSYTHEDATFDALNQVNGYVPRSRAQIIESVADDTFTEYTLKRFRSDPYARIQRPRDFGSDIDKNADKLHKHPAGLWITAPIVWRRRGGAVTGAKPEVYRTGQNSNLLGFLSVDSHRRFAAGDELPDKTQAVKETIWPIALSPEQLAYQKCIVDLATHILATIVQEILTRPPASA